MVQHHSMYLRTEYKELAEEAAARPKSINNEIILSITRFVLPVVTIPQQFFVVFLSLCHDLIVALCAGYGTCLALKSSLPVTAMSSLFISRD